MGGRLVSKLLQGKGSVVVLTMPGQANLEERLHGYQAAFEPQSGIKISHVVDIQGKPQVAFDASAAILDKEPKKVDAFVCLEAIAGKEVAEVVNRVKMSDKIIVAMDADPGTLEWVQKPFTWRSPACGCSTICIIIRSADWAPIGPRTRPGLTG
jgi:ribose transport system substrate-binding protein